MKRSTLLKRAAAAVATLIILAAGVPCVSAAGKPHDIGSSSLTISTNGSYVVTGSTESKNITVNSGVTATITLQNVKIDSFSHTIDLQPGSNVTLLLDGANLVTSTVEDKAGIHVPEGSTLIIDKVSPAGILRASGGTFAAGIGGSYRSNSGSITILGGTVLANGGPGGAGIGGGFGGSGGTINISDGTVTANGGPGGAGMGGGQCGNCGIINILGGTVTANGIAGAAGIGGGMSDLFAGENKDVGNGGNITISGGSVKASGGNFLDKGQLYGGAGIGGAYNGKGGSVKILGSNTTVTVTGGMQGLDIGAGDDKPSADGGTLSVEDGAHLTLMTGMTNILPANVTFGDCIVDGPGAGTRTNSPVFAPSASDAGVELNVSALMLPEDVSLVSEDISGLPNLSTGKVWSIIHQFCNTQGIFRGREFLALYKLSLTDESGKPVTGYIGRVVVRLPIPPGHPGSLTLLYYNESTGRFTEMAAGRDGQYLTYTTADFGSYLITETAPTDADPAIPETGAPSFPYAAAGVVVVLTLFSASILRKRLKQ